MLRLFSHINQITFSSKLTQNVGREPWNVLETAMLQLCLETASGYISILSRSWQSRNSRIICPHCNLFRVNLPGVPCYGCLEKGIPEENIKDLDDTEEQKPELYLTEVSPAGF